MRCYLTLVRMIINKSEENIYKATKSLSSSHKCISQYFLLLFSSKKVSEFAHTQRKY